MMVISAEAEIKTVGEGKATRLQVHALGLAAQIQSIGLEISGVFVVKDLSLMVTP